MERDGESCGGGDLISNLRFNGKFEAWLEVEGVKRVFSKGTDPKTTRSFTNIYGTIEQSRVAVSRFS
jgi:hypothetical protein